MQHHLEPARRSKRMHLANYPTHHLGCSQSKADGDAAPSGSLQTSCSTNTPSGMQTDAAPPMEHQRDAAPSGANTARQSPPDLGCRTKTEQKRNIYHQNTTIIVADGCRVQHIIWEPARASTITRRMQHTARRSPSLGARDTTTITTTIIVADGMQQHLGFFINYHKTNIL